MAAEAGLPESQPPGPGLPRDVVVNNSQPTIATTETSKNIMANGASGTRPSPTAPTAVVTADQSQGNTSKYACSAVCVYIQLWVYRQVYTVRTWIYVSAA